MIRIVHVLGRLNTGGVETWLLDVARHADRARFEHHFVVHSTDPGVYDDEIRGLGCRIVVAPEPQRPDRYHRNFDTALQALPGCDVLHSHVHFFSGFVSWLGARHQIPVRLVHSHNDTGVEDRSTGPLRRSYLGMMRRSIRRHATAGLAASEQAAVSLFGEQWQRDARWRLLLYGMDLAPYRAPSQRERVRGELGLPQDAITIGHIGRFVPQKNHAFLLAMAEIAMRRDERVHLLLIGDGPLRDEMRRATEQLGIADRVVFTGVRRDVARLLRGAIDVFAFPSTHEGLGLVLLEAQAAGVPCVLSDVVPAEATVVAELTTRLGLDEPAEQWATAILDAAAAPRDTEDAWRKMHSSPFNIETSVKRLEETYTCLTS